MSTATHELATAQLDLLAVGGGDRSTVRALRAGQLSKHILLVRALTDAAVGHHGRHQLMRGYELLSSLQQTQPAIVASALLHPHIGAWAVHCLNRLYGVAESDDDLEADLGYLAAAAASAAIRAGVPFEIDVPVRDWRVLLPGLGGATVRSDSAKVHGDVSRAWVASSGTRIEIPRATERGGQWRALRHLRASAGGLSISVDLDDLDPFRGHAYPDVAAELPDAEVREWQRVFEATWTLLVRDHRPYAQALATGLRSIVPQVSVELGRSISATSTDAFGSIAMSRPADAATFAVTLIHEFQHAKLSALLDLTPLYESRTGTLYYAPWRDDPRPLGGLLQGAYAFLGVTDFWRVRRRVVSADDADLASFEFARWREQTVRAVDELAQSPDLTELGKRVVSGLGSTLRNWANEQVPDDLARQAHDSAADHQARWRVRNLRPAAEAITGLAARWHMAEPPGTVPVRAEVVSGAAAAKAETAQFRLWHLRMTDPDRFLGVCAGAGRSAGWADISEADISYARGAYDAAMPAYRAEIRRDPGRISNWIGLGLAQVRVGDTGPGLALLRHPEILLALYRVLRADGEDVDPDDLARWLCGAAQADNQDDGNE